MTIYLYVKTHNKTGLKYLGFTRSSDPFSYKGSGKYWKAHIKKHGYDISTKILLSTTDIAEVKATGLFFSKLWSVVESEEWANLVEESGDGITHSPETKAKMRAAAIGRKASDETRAKFSETHKGASNPMSKTWTLIDPNGAEHTITGKFQTFCDEHQILASALRWYRGKPVPPVATNTLGGFRSKSELSELKRQNTSGWCLY